jgi:shikimate dehydrogenase
MSPTHNPPLRTGLIGHPVAHSLSPAMQQAAFDELGLRARYDLWDTTHADLAARVASLRAPGMLGANVTIPHKAAVVPLMDDLDITVRTLTGVVNTITRDASGRLIGHNTDMPALLRVLDEHGTAPSGCHALVLGAGGAAEAVVAGLWQRGCGITLATRHASRGVALLDRLRTRVGGTKAGPAHLWEHAVLALGDETSLLGALARSDVLINATPVGTRDSASSPLSAEQLAALPAHAFVFDLIYTPPETRLLRLARARGLAGCGGLDMLLYQGAAAFTLWTGLPAPLDVMRQALVLA